MKDVKSIKRFKGYNVDEEDTQDKLIEYLENIIKNSKEDDSVNKEAIDYLDKLNTPSVSKKNYLYSSMDLKLQNDILDFSHRNKKYL